MSSRHDRDKPITGRPTPFKGRTFERTQGCWNCIHFENGEKSKQFWELCKKRDLASAAAMAAADPRGEKTPSVINTRKMVRDAGAAIQAGLFGICTTLNPAPEVKDFVQASFLCDRWTGRQGASVARAGSGLDSLPAELKEKIDGDG